MEASLTSYAHGEPTATPARIELVPPFAQSSAEEILELAAACGINLIRWQKHALTAMLGERADRHWAAPECGLVLPRQNGKTYLMAARIIGGLLILREPLILFTSHEFKTAIEVFRVVDTALRSNRSTAKLLKPTRWSHGEETIETRDGCRFKIMARTRSSGLGFSADCVVLDEALELRDDTAMGALMPTLSARENPQLIYVSSAGDPGSLVLSDVRKRALAGDDPGLCYLEYSAPPECDIDDRRHWFAANPALPELVSIEAVERERRALTVERFRQHRLGIWSGESIKSVIPIGAWQNLIREAPDPEPRSLTIAYDVTPDRSWSSIAAAWNAGSTPHVRLSRHAPGDNWLVDHLAELHKALRVPICYDDAGPARDIAAMLTQRGVPVRKFTLRDSTEACAGMLSAIVNGRVTHHPDPALDDAVTSAGSRRVGEAWMFSRRDATKPIAPIVAATLAHWALITADAPLAAFRIF